MIKIKYVYKNNSRVNVLKNKRIIIIVLAVCFAVLLFVLPTVSKAAVSAFLIKETAADLSGRPSTSQTVKLQKGDYVIFGEYLNEPMLWQVLDTDDSRTLLMTKYIICLKAFDANGADERHDGEDREKYGSNEWSGSTLSQWLNSSEQNVAYIGCEPDKGSVVDGYNAYNGESGFLSDDNFSLKQREMISDDGVFILSKSELSKHLKASQRVKTCTASAVRDNEAPYLLTTSKKTWYWTSSPAESNRVSVAAVTTSGGYYKVLAYDGVTGVAPALYLDGIVINTNGGDGSENNPYFVCR